MDPLTFLGTVSALYISGADHTLSEALVDVLPPRQSLPEAVLPGVAADVETVG